MNPFLDDLTIQLENCSCTDPQYILHILTHRIDERLKPLMYAAVGFFSFIISIRPYLELNYDTN